VDFFFSEDETEFITTAARHAQPIGESPATVVVISAKDIEESGASTLSELLRRYPPVRSYMFDPLYPTAEARGTIRILLSINGRPVNLEMFIAPFYAVLPVGLKDVQRIEIVMGPNSALYGPNAVSAVINIVTRRPDTALHADLSLAAGNHGTSVLEGMLSGGVGPLALKATLGIDRADSWIHTDQISRDLTRGTLGAVLDLPAGELGLDCGLVMGSGRFYGIMGYMEFSEILLAHAVLDYTYEGLKIRGYWYGIRSVFDLDIDLYHPDTGLDLGELPTFHLSGDTWQLEAQYDMKLFDTNLLIAGVDFRFNRFASDQLVEPEATEYRLGVFLHDEQWLGRRLLATLSARFDYNSISGAALSPRLGIVYRPVGEHRLRLSGGIAYRKPLLLETSANFQVDSDFPEIETLFEKEGISNPDLKNELLSAVELGYRGSMLDGMLQVDTHAYLGVNRDWIGFATEVAFREFNQIDLENSRFGYDNFGDDTNVAGFCLSLEGEPVEALTLFLRGELRYEWVHDTGKENDQTTNVLAAAGFTLRLPPGLSLHLTGVYNGPHLDDLRDPQSILEPVIWYKLPGYAYLMGALLYRHRIRGSRLDLGLTVFNPFGARFRESAGKVTTGGTNYGAEPLGMRTMLTVRWSY
jgi:iron complex outermembrane receptor protein